jgi:hypothetical protein
MAFSSSSWLMRFWYSVIEFSTHAGIGASLVCSSPFGLAWDFDLPFLVLGDQDLMELLEDLPLSWLLLLESGWFLGPLLPRL